ncbi:ABC transporter ATP-binding protein/permease [Ornithinimicrobium sp. F0845]|uniref:ABC transporter ATP-binding protein n=1 Tax=Ornithinimicrobium sp. F0845 TaxID=2926412 RepID=UPI001FF26D4B|nr:ABC transporter ATP-binding protein [Ornithinimicrobium sp. F0845]MCK0110531.1 ABC transporter ATP-binding protein/permease [Ornithinimicrobium sp. F0845]
MNLVETVRATRRILDRPTQRALVLATIATVIIALFDTVAIALVLPLVTIASGAEDTSGVGSWVASMLGDPDPRTLVIIMTSAVVTLFILKDFGAIAYTWWLTSFKVLKRVELSTRLLQHFLRTPYTQVSRRSSAELLRTMNDAVVQFYNTTVFGLMTLVSNVASLIAIAIALLVSAPLPSLALGAYFAVATFFYLHVMKPRSIQAGKVAVEASSAAYRTAFAALGAIKEAKLRGSQPFFVERYREASLRGAYASRTAGFISAIPRYLLEILFILAVGLLLLSSTLLADGAGEGLGVLALFVAAGLRALPAVTSLVGQVSNVRFGAGFVDIVLTEVQAEQHHVFIDGDNESAPVSFDNAVVLEGVSFTYPDASVPAVSSLNLVIPHGSSIAIVGSSGAGKTTLVDLILGLHRPSEGRISIDGQDIEDNLTAWQRVVGYVPQEVFLQEATLAENVAFDQTADQIDPSKLYKAIERAQLEDVVASFEEGLWEPIGERGSRLSGGQRQRIGIARAIYQEPHLLVLDEATSALDNETEHRVSEAIRELHGELTMVIVAHRLSTVRHVDTVVLMHEGQIEAIGTFEEVRRLSPRFARMVQFGSLS